ncbi:MAG: YkgJ family cysteine cluster protein [Candidatus Abyssobacteria bacterium SURF_5]|uniref:YkgJ family cysteine cluster protein n=1 Tax=Abyssobacteria bacterium (strain SURF_5) TaxID=2093360 RepID=A0A3A4NNV3_ABYX5|nr:MAG: YkgJ family cysteine cluster protein [Candidatus Abyssubacteria bacterium SURF_5]
MKDFEDIKEAILTDAPRFKETDRFKFSCHRGVSCFTDCCADVNIFLTPYDILRMKKRLGISSDEFLSRYTLIPFNEKQQVPVVVLKMLENEKKQCPFLSPGGCTIYEDRPWACRMYPLGLASPKDNGNGEEQFYFLMQEGNCCGFKEEKEWSVRQWLEDQGIIEYNKMGESFKAIALHEYLQQGNHLDPDKMEMYHMACYNLDKFRRFVFESRFLSYFDIDAELAESLRNDDLQLMQFGFRWLRFALFNEPSIKIRDEVLAIRKIQLGKQAQ